MYMLKNITMIIIIIINMICFYLCKIWDGFPDKD